MSKPIVPIADDHKSLRRLLRDWLLSEPPHCEISDANCAEEALRIAGKNTLVLVVMDIGFSGMSGNEATRRLLKQDPGLPIVILCVYDEDSQERGES
jgi:DNA-binding NarL/FixJ family response regulator